MTIGWNAEMLNIYVLVFGTVLCATACIEIIIPSKMIAFWRIWISHRLFFLHGAFLILVGIPLTCYSHHLTGRLVTAIGLLIVFTGPFVLFYSERISSMILSIMEETRQSGKRSLIYIDSALRLIVGIIFIYSALSYGQTII